jgi:hypothetical protein
VAITSLTSYISRIRRREGQERQREEHAEFHADSPPGKAAMEKSDHPARWPPTSSTNTVPLPKQHNDPLAQAMQALSKPRLDIREIHSDGDPSGKNLI